MSDFSKNPVEGALDDQTLDELVLFACRDSETRIASVSSAASSGPHGVYSRRLASCTDQHRIQPRRISSSRRQIRNQLLILP